MKLDDRDSSIEFMVVGDQHMINGINYPPFLEFNSNVMGRMGKFIIAYEKKSERINTIP